MNSQTCIFISKERTSQSTDGQTGGRTECEEGVGKGMNGKAGGRDAEENGEKEGSGKWWSGSIARVKGVT